MDLPAAHTPADDIIVSLLLKCLIHNHGILPNITSDQEIYFTLKEG